MLKTNSITPQWYKRPVSNKVDNRLKLNQFTPSFLSHDLILKVFLFSWWIWWILTKQQWQPSYSWQQNTLLQSSTTVVERDKPLRKLFLGNSVFCSLWFTFQSLRLYQQVWGTSHIERLRHRQIQILPKIQPVLDLYYLSFYFFEYLFLLYLAALGLSFNMQDLFPWPGSLALEALSLSHWTTREVPYLKKKRKWVLMVRSHKTGQKRYWRIMIPVHYRREPVQTEIPVHCFFSPLSYWRGKDWAEWGWGVLALAFPPLPPVIIPGATDLSSFHKMWKTRPHSGAGMQTKFQVYGLINPLPLHYPVLSWFFDGQVNLRKSNFPSQPIP